ncbi:Nitrogen assimilation transcription factor nirA [Tolypocladium ophioglossoides CBS 100239]|uniref:Nitrogen assimilation transcription factor nirA n=1 Tax=Tolypocladium ophioglossoides (strain CBS 100239) TaxID=1163406 RepID=A0A0L0NC66_TOLOC|nr:Nitrogen assimilation transcription factor nirA [Tolypocladium ophioglossoides CBS 100239]
MGFPSASLAEVSSPRGAAVVDNSLETGSSPSSVSSPEGKLLSDLSLDENGKACSALRYLCFYEPTSAVHAPPALEQQSTSSPAYDMQPSKSDVRSLLTSSALESRAWEDFALANATLQSSIPQHSISRLVPIHWTSIAPMFMWVYRPAFMRDMAIGGPYYSPFLLTVLCAHAARFDEGKLSEVLISRARLLLGNEIHQQSPIPTVQALLQLSARDLAYGSISQAWFYSGMAFRMLHHSAGKIASFGDLSAEDIEIRRRLFWSCYFRGKAISPYLGRMPVLQDLPFDQPPELLDDSAEYEEWSPYCGGAMNLSRLPITEYPPMKSHLVSCFENSCKLAVIINDIIIPLYSRRGAPNVDDTLSGIRHRLNNRREESPPHLKCAPENLPDICPPPHILTQNLLYYTTIILLHRPFYSTLAHHNACRRASDSVEKLLLLLEKTFGFVRITYLMAYCIYTAASVMTQDVKTGYVEATLKMQTFLRALRQGGITCPVLQHSLNIITRSLESDAVNMASCRANSAAGDGFTSRNYLPAFPVLYWDPDVDDLRDTNQGGMDLDGLSFLESFPENYFENMSMIGEWHLPP